MLPATAVSLAVLAALLAWPVPALLARARWPRRDPLVALVCWQAIGLAGGLSIIGALLVHGLAPWGHSLPEAGWSLLTGQPAADPVRGDHWVALTLAAVLAFELLGVLAALLGADRPHPAAAPGPARARRPALGRAPGHPAARPPRAGGLLHPGRPPAAGAVVGHRGRAGRGQLAAVVAHERAHLREHHHLLLLPFVAWEAALPVLPAAARAHAAVRELVEMRADDVALTSLPGPGARRTLAHAIVAAAGGIGGAGVPDGALAVTGSRDRRPRRPAAPARAAACRRPPGGPRCCRAGLLLLLPTALLVLPAL